MCKFFLILSGLLLVAPALSAQSPVQTVRGRVIDADSGAPLNGANVSLSREQSYTAATDEHGKFLLNDIPVGRYRLQVSFVGYETVVIAEVLAEAGKEVVIDVQLRARSEALQEVVVKAQGRSGAEVPAASVYTLTVEEQFRLPATYFDPARVAMSYPGVTGQYDGTNIISVRGNSPAAVKWRLEGVEIVNPNHTANAGTFSDRPTQAAGGVNILSAQLLGNSHFLAGAYPAGYGNSLGGILDLRMRDGNDRKHEFTAQAGLIGIDLAAEGPLGSGANVPSYLINYRYSFTGLLTAMGIDFGGEEIGFQDLSFRFSLPSFKAGKFSFFAIGGKSYTLFHPPGDTAQIIEDKQRFEIDFQSKMGAAGLTHVLPLGKKSVIRSSAVVSALEHSRIADMVWRVPEKTRWEDDTLVQRKISISSVFSTRIGARHRLRAGVEASQEYSRFFSLYTANLGVFTFSGKMDGWLLQPFAEWHADVSPRLDITAGFHLSHFTGLPDEISPEPRLSVRYTPWSQGNFSLSYGLLSQMPLPQVFERGLEFTRSHHLVAGYRQSFSQFLVLQAELYYQYLFDLPVAADPAITFSALNLVEAFRIGEYTLEATGTGRNYGLDISLQKFILDRYYFIAAGSLYRSLYTAADGVERPTRFDGRYLLNLTGGREFFQTKKQKTRIWGINAHLLWMGGFRASPLDLQGSKDMGYTVYDESEAFPLKQQDYFRLDLRFYLKWNKARRNSTLSVDLQNLTGRRNAAYEYYDFVQGKVQEKRQLGLIPIINWRIEF